MIGTNPDRSRALSLWGMAQKNSLRSSRDGGSTTSLYGLVEISSTGTQMMWLMTRGSTVMRWPTTAD
jgi:hypothetical protein